MAPYITHSLAKIITKSPLQVVRHPLFFSPLREASHFYIKFVDVAAQGSY